MHVNNERCCSGPEILSFISNAIYKNPFTTFMGLDQHFYVCKGSSDLRPLIVSMYDDHHEEIEWMRKQYDIAEMISELKNCGPCRCNAEEYVYRLNADDIVNMISKLEQQLVQNEDKESNEVFWLENNLCKLNKVLSFALETNQDIFYMND